MEERNGALAEDVATVPVERLEAEICELAGHMWAAECRWLLMVGEYDRREGWSPWGLQSCAHWLSWRCGVALNAARERVRVARRLPELPLVTAAFSRGELSYAKVRALSRVANDANEPELVEIARTATASQLERIVRTYRKAQVESELAEANERHQAERAQWYWDDDGSLVLSTRLPPEDGALVLAALEAGRRHVDVSAETSTCAARNADALVGMARLALSAVDHDDRGDAPTQVVLHVDAPVLASDAPEGRCHLENGPSLPPETGRRISCDAEVIAVIHDRDAGSILDVGRKTRRVSPGLRRALRARDGGCRFPGCSNRRFVDAHHLVHWVRGGETKLGNLALLCRRHHRLVHEAGYGITVVGEGFQFTRPDGTAVDDAPTMTPAGGPGIEERHTDAGLTIEPATCRSLGEGEPYDLGMTIDAVLYPELRRRGRSWGVATPVWTLDTLPERLLKAVPDFRPLFDEHVEDFEEVLPRTLFDSFTTFVLDAYRRDDAALLTRCLGFLAAAVGSGDDEIRQLIGSSFIETVNPWDDTMREFVSTWPHPLRVEAERMEQGVLTG
ncbi:MAG: DUF7674 family protein [Acidimicrobiia bacterium]